MPEPNPYEPPSGQTPGRPRVRVAFVLLAIFSLPAGAIAGCGTCTATVLLADTIGSSIDTWIWAAFILGGVVGFAVMASLMYFAVKRISAPPKEY